MTELGYKTMTRLLAYLLFMQHNVQQIVKFAAVGRAQQSIGGTFTHITNTHESEVRLL